MTNYVDGIKGRGPYRKLPGQGETPDIVMISFDMVPREFYLPRSGDLAPRTPNIDRLRQDGLFFSNAWAASPLCSPSRAALFTGRYPYIVANGERYHDGQTAHIREDDTIFQEYLKAAGYRTRHFGKCHVGAAKFIAAFGENDAPWDRWSPPWYDDDGYRNFLRQKGIGGFRFSREIRGRAAVASTTNGAAAGSSAKTGGGQGNFLGGWVCQDSGAPFPTDAAYPAYITGMALTQLENTTAGPRQPFYTQIDYFEPHQPFFIPAGYEEREKELRAALSLPASWEEAVKGGPSSPEPLIYSRYRTYWGLNKRQTAEDYLIANVLQYEILDAQIGRIMESLKKNGLYDKTMIILTADHGEMNCRGALVDKGSYLNPRVLQVPLYLKLPAEYYASAGYEAPAGSGEVSSKGAAAGETGPGAVIDRLCSLLDIAPTVLAAAGIEAQARFDGQSLLAPPPPEGRRLLAEVFSHVLPNPAAALIRETAGKTEMYTLNFADRVHEYYRREGPADAAFWPEENAVSRVEEAPRIACMVRDMLDFFSADDRWAAYAAFLKLIHAELLGTSADLQKFVSP